VAGESKPSEAPAAGGVGRWWLRGVSVVGDLVDDSGAVAAAAAQMRPGLREPLEPSAHMLSRDEPSQLASG